MSRTISLKELLPVYLTEYLELDQVLTTENIELQNIENSHWQLVNNRYFNTADENGIAVFERLLGIHPPDDATLEERRFKVGSMWNSTLPYNYQYLTTKLEALVGSSRYSISFPTALTLRVRIDLRSSKMMDSVREMLEEVIPCNIVIDLMLQYNEYQDYFENTHNELTQYTHTTLREGIFDE